MNATHRHRSSIGPMHALRSAGLLGATFLFMIPMQIHLGSATPGLALVVSGCLALRYLFGELAARRPLDAEHRLFGLLALLGTYFLCVAVLGEARDFSMAIMCLYGAVMFAAALVLARSFRRLYPHEYIKLALKFVFAVGLIHTCIQILVLASPPVAKIVYGIVELTDNSATHIKQGYRSPGLFASGDAILGTFNAWILLVGIVAFLHTPRRLGIVQLLPMALATLLLVVGIAISGRTGFVVVLIGLPMIWLYEGSTDRRSRLGRNLTRLIVLIGLLATLALLWIGTESIEKNLKWSFEFIFSLANGEGLHTKSTSVLFDKMFFVPDGFWHLLFGTSNFGRSPDFPYIESDVGYILLLFGGGFIGTLLAMVVFVHVLLEARRTSRHDLALLLTIFVVSIGIVNVKDFYFLQNSGVTQILLLTLALLVVWEKDRRAARAAASLHASEPAAAAPLPSGASAAAE